MAATAMTKITVTITTAFMTPVTPLMDIAVPVIVAAKDDDIRRGRPNHGHAAAIAVHVTNTAGKYDQKRSGK
ncbi:MAG TPA: hypothetical protein VMO20_06220 [Candidatus Acidoferrum sp.]|nr:hypothetical protein [Candidatus Acidoferrum sp.]